MTGSSSTRSAAAPIAPQKLSRPPLVLYLGAYLAGFGAIVNLGGWLGSIIGDSDSGNYNVGFTAFTALAVVFALCVRVHRLEARLAAAERCEADR